jgi:hypothetical protein
MLYYRKSRDALTGELFWEIAARDHFHQFGSAFAGSASERPPFGVPALHC